MASRNGLTRQLARVRSKFVEELDINTLLPRLLVKRLFTLLEEKEILSPALPQNRVEVLLDILSTKDRQVFIEFCRSLEELAPHLLTALVLESQEQGEHEEKSTAAELSSKDKASPSPEDASAHRQEDFTVKNLEDTHAEKNPPFKSLENLSGKETNAVKSSLASASSSSMKELVSVESEQVYEETGPNVVWEVYIITLDKAPSYGFGIAVSGGYDSPHFVSGDPSVAISDVLSGGPAEGKLQINDRIISVNGINLEHVDHNTAISVLRECGSSVRLAVKRRVLLPDTEANRPNSTLKMILTKKNRKDEFGVLLGCKVFIRGIVENSLASQEVSLHTGATVHKINDTSVENLVLNELQKLMDKGKDRLQLEVSTEGNRDMVTKSTVSLVQAAQEAGVLPTRPGNTELPSWPGNTELPSWPGNTETINLFQPIKRAEEGIYVKDPTSRLRPAVPNGAYPNSGNTSYDGRYVLDNNPPSWATLPRNSHRKSDKKHDDLDPAQHNLHDGYYSDQDDGWHGKGAPDQQKSENYIPHEALSMRSFHDSELQTVTFHKDKQTGLGLRLTGGNATGIFIASVHPGSAGQREGLLEGGKIIQANNRIMTGMIREEAVSYLSSLGGQVTLVVQYRRKEYDRLIASNEAGDSFYVRTHFKHVVSDTETEHSFKVGDVFHVKDTLFRGIGGSWLAVRISDGVKQNKKGTIPNSKTAEILKLQQREDSDKENFPNRGRGSLFRRKSISRRSKSLGKDCWERIIFAGRDTKFPAYERVVYREPGFVRPVILFGAISDIARERLLADYPGRFESIQTNKTTEETNKKDKGAVITLGSIREAVARHKHCLLDITPYDVDKLNYAQYNPIVILLKAESKQAVKDVRGRWKNSMKSPRKLLEQSDKIEKSYPHLFTGQLKYTSTDSWFPKLAEMIESQQRRKIWMSEQQPVEDISDDFMFPMSSRMSCTTGTSSHVDIARLQSQLDISPMGMQQQQQQQQVGRYLSDPSVNVLENTPGVPPSLSSLAYKNQRKASPDTRNSVGDVSRRSTPRHIADYQMQAEDRYYPSCCADGLAPHLQDSRAHTDHYATLTTAEKLRSPVQSNTFRDVPHELESAQKKTEELDHISREIKEKPEPAVETATQTRETQVQSEEQHQGYPDNLSYSSDSYSKYVNSPQNKHDDTKLQEKFGHLHNSRREHSPGPEAYRFNWSTAPMATSSNLDRARFFDHSNRYRGQADHVNADVDKQASSTAAQQTDKDPVIPSKSYTLRYRAVEPSELKVHNTENTNRIYTITETSGFVSTRTTQLSCPPRLATEKPCEHMSQHQRRNHSNISRDINNTVDFPSQQKSSRTASPGHQQIVGRQNLHHHVQQWSQPPTLDYQPSGHSLQDSKAYTNEVYMNQREFLKARQSKLQEGVALGVAGHRARGVRENMLPQERTVPHPQ